MPPPLFSEVYISFTEASRSLFLKRKKAYTLSLVGLMYRSTQKGGGGIYFLAAYFSPLIPPQALWDELQLFMAWIGASSEMLHAVLVFLAIRGLSKAQVSRGPVCPAYMSNHRRLGKRRSLS